MSVRGRICLALCAAALSPAPHAAAQRPPGDSLRLGALQEAAVRRDPRGEQLDLLASQTDLRLRAMDAERLPSLGLLGQGQYQSDVASLPFELPGGATPPSPPLDSYDAHLAARQWLYDPSRGPRRGVERARLAESQSRVRSALHELRLRVSEAFFNLLLLGVRADELEAGITDLEARLRVAARRVEEGAALPSEAGMLEAELLRRRQALDGLAADREAARAVLGDLVGRPVGEAEALALPDLAAEVARARAAPDGVRARPEYEQFARGRELLARQGESLAAGEMPRVSAFGRAGYGRPGLNPLADRFDAYWLTGVRVEWAPWSWGATEREREALALQQRILASEEAAFGERLRREAVVELSAIDRLERALATDDEILALREGIARETRLRFAEGVVTSAEYVDRETDLLDARLARITHRVELARARARFLTLLGLEVR